ncbi:MAG TPA: hypothetical protein VN600_03780 [Gemmatimonadaceae bacterium]|nr:hypothetical protein [Gemmatimonadaceae bacterium]
MHRSHIHGAVLAAAMAIVLPITARPLRAQVRVGSDSSTRLQRFGRDALYGTAEGLAFAGLDQLNNDPPEWGGGAEGYKKRALSNVGEFYIQEGVTEGLAAIMKRPLDYRRCGCRDASRRIGWALQAAVTDPLPNGTHPIAWPRIIGAYAGSFAQASWRPTNGGRSRNSVALLNGAESLGIGFLINLYHEFR